MRNKAKHMSTLVVLLLTATTLIGFPLTAAATPTSIRGERLILRSLKKQDEKQEEEPVAPAQTPQVLPAVGDETEQQEEFEEDEEEEYPQEEEYPEANTNANTNAGGRWEDEEDDNRKDNKDDERDNNEEEEDNISFVKIPILVLGLGVEAGNNHATMESLIEDYFIFLLQDNKDEVMGFNYVSAEFEATLTTTQNFGDSNGARSLLHFKIKGEAAYDNAGPVPGRKEIKEWLVAFFIGWGFDNDLGWFLAKNGVDGAQATDIYVDGIQMPAFIKPSSHVVPPPSSSSTTTTTIDNANAAANDEEPDSGGGKRVGLITGLVFFFLCLLIAGFLLYYSRREIVSECGSWWKTARDKISNKRKKNSSGRDWQDFDGEDEDSDLGSIPGQINTLPSSSTDQSTKPERNWTVWFHDRPWFQDMMQREKEQKQSSTKPKLSWRSWFAQRKEEESSHPTKGINWKSWFPQRKEEVPSKGWRSWLPQRKEEEPSQQILSQIQVVVDNDHVLKQGGGNRVGSYRNYILPEDVSGGIVSHQHSAATVPVANFGGRGPRTFEDISPQKTLNTAGPSDEEDEVSLDDPVVRWAPPTRSRSKLYRDRSSTTRERTAPSHKKKAPAPPPPLEEGIDDGVCIGLSEWTTYLNPCMLPHLPMFQYESERLDDLVASLPRDKSVLDRSDETLPSPPRRPSTSRPPSGRGRFQEM